MRGREEEETGPASAGPLQPEPRADCQGSQKLGNFLTVRSVGLLRIFISLLITVQLRFRVFLWVIHYTIRKVFVDTKTSV